MAGAASEERRIDPEDGLAYTWTELAAYYRGHYSASDIRAYWQHTCTWQGNAAPTRRPRPAQTTASRSGGAEASSYLVRGTSGYTGEIHVVGSLDDAAPLQADFEAAVAAHPLIAVDFEWLPDRSKHHDHPIALAAVATAERAYLFRTCRGPRPWLPQYVRRCLEDPLVAKVVIDPSQDRKKLASTFQIRMDFSEAEGFIDLAVLAREWGFPDPGLRRLAAWYELDIDKPVEVTNSDWNAKVLEPVQVQYGAEDVWVPLLVAGRMLQEPGLCKEGLRERTLGAWRACERGLAANFSRTLADDAAERRLEHQRLSSLPPLEPSGLPEAPPWVLPGYDGKQKAWYKSRREDFAVRMPPQGWKGRGAYWVRARAEVERAPSQAEELELAWADDPRSALRQWLAAELLRTETWSSALGSEALVEYICSRLERLAEAFWSRRCLPAWAALRKARASTRVLQDAIAAARAAAPAEEGGA